jgi:flagellar biogenesis protein FliO
MVQRAWSWLHRKYAIGANKRLRVAETVSLGEKRFVALIRVEDCEFLIGGGSSGVSLLTQLGTVPGAANAMRAELGVQGDSA